MRARSATATNSAAKLLRFTRSARSLVPAREVAALYRGPGLVNAWRASMYVVGACGLRPDKPHEEFISTLGLVPGDCEDLNGVQLGRLVELGAVSSVMQVVDLDGVGHLVLMAGGVQLDALNFGVRGKVVATL